jgi:hypothetical protein
MICFGLFPSSQRAANVNPNSMSKLGAEAFIDNYTPALLAQVSQLVSGEFDVIVQASGFEISDWRVLSTLSDGKAVSIGYLAQVTVTKQPTTSRLLDRLEAQGYVIRDLIPSHTTGGFAASVGSCYAAARRRISPARLATKFTPNCVRDLRNVSQD